MIVTAENFVQGGRTMGHLEGGRIVFLNGLFPGEEAEIKIVDEKKGYCSAVPINIIKRSSLRRKSPCKYSSQCGGCPWIELNYDAQVAAKEELLHELFSDVKIEFLPSVLANDSVTGSVTGSPRRGEFGYRSRARFQYRINGGKASLGFCSEESNNTVFIDKCVIADPALNAFLANPPKINAWELKNMELPCITTDTGVLYGAGISHITINGHALPVSNQVFFQSNLKLLPNLIDYVVSCVDSCTSCANSHCARARVMDLYSGVGTFSAYLEDKYDVVAVEMNKNCLDLAKRHLKKTTFFTSPVEKWSPKHKDVDTVIVDPPRVGLAKEVPAMIASWGPSNIVYVSCFAPTLHRDVQRFEQLGYKAKTLKMFDFYPQTPHTETVVLMSKV